MKLLAVCGFGVGSSMVLKMTLESVLSNLGVSAQVENTDISSAIGMDADAIFTSYELKTQLEKSTQVPIYPIKKYMDKNEVKESLEIILEMKE